MMEWKNKTETIFSIVKTKYLHRLLSIRLVQFPNESQTSTNLKLASNVWSYLSVCMCIYIYLLYLKSIELKLKRKKVYLYILLDSVYIKFPNYYYYYHYINFIYISSQNGPQLRRPNSSNSVYYVSECVCSFWYHFFDRNIPTTTTTKWESDQILLDKTFKQL